MLRYFSVGPSSGAASQQVELIGQNVLTTYYPLHVTPTVLFPGDLIEFLQQPCEPETIIIPILQIGKLRLGKVKLCAFFHTFIYQFSKY